MGLPIYFIQFIIIVIVHEAKIVTMKSENDKISNYATVVGVETLDFYARRQLLLSARLSRRNSVHLSVCPSACHTGGSVKSGAS